MSEARSPRAPHVGFLAARGVVLVATLAGLFVMHGLSDHGGVAHGKPLTMDQAEPSTPHDHTVAPTLEAGEAPLAQLPTASPLPATYQDVSGTRLTDTAGAITQVTGHHAGLMALCLAVLTVALLGTAVGRRGRRGRWRFTARFHEIRPPFGGREPDPPDLLRLAIHRC
jgi:hypothetical protein